MLSAEKRFKFQSEKTARAAAKAVSVELGNRFERRAKTTINTNKNLVLLRVVAEDRQALNASLNSFERLILMCRELAET